MKYAFTFGMFFFEILLMGCIRSGDANLSSDDMKSDWTNVLRQLKFGNEMREIKFLKINDLFIANDLFTERDYRYLIGTSDGSCCPMLGINWIDAVWVCNQVTSNSVQGGLLLNDEIVRLPTQNEIALFFKRTCAKSEGYNSEFCEACKTTHPICEWTFDIKKEESTRAYVWVRNMEKDRGSTKYTNEISLFPCHRASEGSGFRFVVAKKRPDDVDSLREYCRLVDQIRALKLMTRSYPSKHQAVEAEKVKEMPKADKQDVRIELPSGF